MKQTLAMLFVTALLLFSLAGCGEKKDSNTANGPSNGTTDNGAADSGKKKDNMPGDDMSGENKKDDSVTGDGMMGDDMAAFALMTADKSVIATPPSYVNFTRITSPTAAMARWL